MDKLEAPWEVDLEGGLVPAKGRDSPKPELRGLVESGCKFFMEADLMNVGGDFDGDGCKIPFFDAQNACEKL